MSHHRVFQVANHLQPSDGEPIRSVVHETDHAVVVAWTVKPGQRISAHVHPTGQDTWTVIAGEGQYQVDAAGSTVRIAAGDIAVAPAGAVHGVINTGSLPLILVAVVSPAGRTPACHPQRGGVLYHDDGGRCRAVGNAPIKKMEVTQGRATTSANWVDCCIRSCCRRANSRWPI
jgi:quercetin dioxygenase-like cupin family protein